MATSGAASGGAKADDGVKFTITVQCNVGGEKRAVSYTVFKRTLMSQVFDSSVQFFKLDPSQVILVVKNKVALTHKCVEDYRLSDKSVLDLIHLKEAPTIGLTLRDQAGNSKSLTASTYHPLSDVVKAFCKHLNEETGFSDLYHGGIALDLDASPASIGLKTGEQLFCYCYKAACKQHWVSVGKPEQAKTLRFIKFYFSDWKYGYKTFPIFRHDISTPMEVLIKTFCAWRGLDYEQTGFLYSYTYKQVQLGDTATNKALADGDTILAYNRQDLQGRLWDSVLAGSCHQVVDLLDQGAELSTSIGPEEWGKHPLHAAVANGHVELVKLLLQGEPGVEELLLPPPSPHHRAGARGSGGGSVDPAVAGAAGPAGGGHGAGGGGSPGSSLAGAAASTGAAPGAASGVAGSGSSTSSSSSHVGALGSSSSHDVSVSVGVSGGCDPNQLDYASDPPLWHAVENNLVGLVELLLAAGATAADIPPRDRRPKGQAGIGYSACPHAARKGHAETLRMLLGAGANPWLPDADGYTAYDYALDHAKPPAVVAALLEGDARFGEMQRSFQAAYQRMCQMLKRTQRYPALGCPCRTCNSLLEIRAPETDGSRLVREQIGCVALVRAVQAGGPHCVEVMELLLKHGALLDGQDYDGRTALHQAIRYNRVAEAAWLTSKGAHLDIPDFEGLLPLHQAGCSGFCDITRLLVTAGAPMNLHTIKYVSQEALDAQAKKQAEGHLGSKKAKRKQQLDVSGLTTIGGNSPLALAIRHGHGAIVEYLLSQNAVFDLKNAADSSAFHAALDKGSAAIAGLLLQHINKKAGAGGGASGAAAVAAALGCGGSGGGAAAAAAGKALAAREKDREARLNKKESKREAASKEREKEGREREKDGRDTAGTGSGSDGGGWAGGADGSAAAAAPPSTAEPPVAFDAGAGLREMVLRERERLRQQLGLSTAGGSCSGSSGAGASAASAAAAGEPKPMLSIFARSGSTASAPMAPRPAPLPSADVSRPAAQGPTPAAGGSGASSGGASSAAGSCSGSVLEEKGSGTSGARSSSGACDSAASASNSSSNAASLNATPPSSTSASPKVLTDEEGIAPEPDQLQQRKATAVAAAAATGSAAVPPQVGTGGVPEQNQCVAAAAAGAATAAQRSSSSARGRASTEGSTSGAGAATETAAILSLAVAQANGPKLLPAREAAVPPAQSSPPPPQAPAAPSVKPAPLAAPVATSAVPTAAPPAPATSGKGGPVKEPPKPPARVSSVASIAAAKVSSKPGLPLAALLAENTLKAANGTAAVPTITSATAPAAPVVSPIKVKFRAKPVDPSAAAPAPAAPAAPTAQAAAAPSSEAASISYIKTRRGKVITVPLPITPNRYLRGSSSADLEQQPQQPQLSHHSGGNGADPHVPAYLTIPASLLSGGPGRHLAGSGAAAATAAAAGSGRATAAGVAAGASSGLRPAAPSYSPRGVAPQQQQQQPPSSSAPKVAPQLSDPGTESAALGGALPQLGPRGFSHHPHHPHSHHAHMQAPGGPLPSLAPPPPPPGALAAPPPPPGFAPRGMSGRPSPPPPGLLPLAHAPAPAAPPPAFAAAMAAAADAGMSDMDRHLESSLESMVLSVVDQGLEESVGVGALGDRLRLGSAGSGSLQHQPNGAGGGGGGLAAGNQPAVAGAGADGLWPTPAELAAAMLHSGGNHPDMQLVMHAAAAGMPQDRLQGGPAAGLSLAEAAAGLRRSLGPPAGVPPVPPGAMHGGGSGGHGDAGGGGGGGSMPPVGQYLNASVAAAMASVHSGELAALGGLLDRNSSLAAPSGASVAGGADVAIAAAGAILDGGDGAGGDGLLRRAASHQALSRYDSGALQSSHGASLALFSDVWAADGGVAAKGAGAGGGGPGSMDGSGAEWRGGHSDSWAALAEAQQLQLSQAMEALGSGPAVAVAGALLHSAPAAPAVAAQAPAGDGGGGAAAADRADALPAELDPLPHFPLSLYDDDDQHQQRVPNDQQHQQATHGRNSENGGSGAPGGTGDTRGGMLGGGPQGRSAAAASGLEPPPPPPPPPPGGNRPTLYTPAGGPVGPGLGRGIGQMSGASQMPYGHGPGIMYPQSMGTHGGGGAYGGGHSGYLGGGGGPYNDWYGTGGSGPYMGYRSPQGPMLGTPGGGMYGNVASGAAMSGLRGGGGGLVGGGVGGPHGANAAAAGSFTGGSHSHALQGAQQAAAPAGAQGSAWFSGGGGKAAAISGLASRGSNGGPDGVLAAGAAAGGGGGSSSGGVVAGRHGQGRGGKGRR